MPYEASFMSSNTLAQSLKRFANNGKPDVDIRFDEHDGDNHTYTTADSLSGTVSITSPGTVRFDEVHITLEGISQTFIELMSPVAHQTRQSASYRFLNLTMPVPDAAYPVPRIAESGLTYTFPFNFVVPSHLLLGSCTHPCTDDELHVRAAHLRLPPSLGAHQSPKDDLAPDMAAIKYGIRVLVTRTREHDNKLVSLVDKTRPIRIIPAIPESPPLHIADVDSEYTLSASKLLKKGVFKGKLGTLTLSAAQTKAITAPRSPLESAPTILATLHLRFDPASAAAKPPRLGSLASKIRASTFFSIRPVRDLPTRPTALSQYEIHRRVYSESVTLASRCVEAVEWSWHPSPPSPNSPLEASPEYSPYVRRDSGYSTSSSSGSDTVVPSAGAGAEDPSRGHYSAKILVPLSLPSSKTWLPTFHTCTVSRIYQLDMALTSHTPGAGVPATTLAVRLPLELISDADASAAAAAGMGIEAYGGWSVEEQVDADLVPRTLEAMNPEFVGRSGSIVAQTQAQVQAQLVDASAPVAAGGGAGADLPPGYEALGRGGVAVQT